MIDFYTWTTPNGRKVSIMLEECGLPYNVHPVNIGQGDQFRPEFVAINPNSKIPAIADIATYPWVARYEWHKTELADYPHVKRWFDKLSARPAVQRGMKVPA